MQKVLIANGVVILILLLELISLGTFFSIYFIDKANANVDVSKWFTTKIITLILLFALLVFISVILILTFSIAILINAKNIDENFRAICFMVGIFGISILIPIIGLITVFLSGVMSLYLFNKLRKFNLALPANINIPNF